MPRVVLDPGVLVSALITPLGPPSALWAAVRDGRLDLVVSPGLLAELAGVLRRPKFRPYVTLDEADRFVREVAELAAVLPDPPVTSPTSRDPDDEYLFALAAVAGVDAIVSGDRDLTDAPDTEPPVLSPRAALDQLL